MSTLAVSRHAFVVTTIVTAATASIAALASLTFSLPVWAMFIGWIAFFTRVKDTGTALENLACVGIGMIIGAGAALAIPSAATIVGPALALSAVVFLVALLVVALRGLPAMKNLLGYFLGLVAWFAAHLEPSLESILQLLGASAVGLVAGWVSHHLPVHILPRASAV